MKVIRMLLPFCNQSQIEKVSESRVHHILYYSTQISPLSISSRKHQKGKKNLQNHQKRYFFVSRTFLKKYDKGFFFFLVVDQDKKKLEQHFLLLWKENSNLSKRRDFSQKLLVPVTICKLSKNLTLQTREWSLCKGKSITLQLTSCLTCVRSDRSTNCPII